MSTVLVAHRFAGARSSTPASLVFLPRQENSDQTPPSTEVYDSWRDAVTFCQELREAAFEASQNGWDGCGSVALRPASIPQACSVIDSLPSTFPFPSVSVLASGALVLEWIKNSDLTIAVIADGTSRLRFSALIRGDQIYGSFDYTNDELPQEFVAAIQRWASL